MTVSRERKVYYGTHSNCSSFIAINLLKGCAGPVAQRIRHLTTNQGIAGSSPARVIFFVYITR